MPTPLEYAERYRSLTVGFSDGPSTITIDQYLQGRHGTKAKPVTPWSDEADRLIDACREDFKNHKKKDSAYSLEVTVNGQTVGISDESVLLRILHYAFEGKGSPEDCQVGAQLAVLHKRTTKANLQKYCNQNMGLDCTGFVGSYLWYANAGHKWPDDMPKDDQGSNAEIDQILLNETTPLSDLDLITPTKTYIFGLLDSSNRHIVAKDGAEHAHIVISEPNKFTRNSFVFNSFGGFTSGNLDKQKNTIYGHTGLICVESTSHKGLIDSWYAVVPYMDGKTQMELPHHPGFKVFSVFRGSKGEWLNFTIGSI
ncbi:MAG TPA: hypothetical protein VKV39_11890 [Candidatus Sulfotelmatobacter sp.]|nr:hypothetical protein [Candidatus Sulfotelmatobacter sp.]